MLRGISGLMTSKDGHIAHLAAGGLEVHMVRTPPGGNMSKIKGRRFKTDIPFSRNSRAAHKNSPQYLKINGKWIHPKVNLVKAPNK